MTIKNLISFMEWRGFPVKQIEEWYTGDIRIKKYHFFGEKDQKFENLIITEHKGLNDDIKISCDHKIGNQQYYYNIDSIPSIFKKEWRDYLISNLINHE